MVLPIYPSSHQWQLFALYQQYPSPMHPDLFLKTWAVSYAQLAKISGVSRSTVEHWFSTGITHRDPSILHCRQLAIVHYLWCNADRIPPEVIQLWRDSIN